MDEEEEPELPEEVGDGGEDEPEKYYVTPKSKVSKKSKAKSGKPKPDPKSFDSNRKNVTGNEMGAVRVGLREHPQLRAKAFKDLEEGGDWAPGAGR